MASNSQTNRLPSFKAPRDLSLLTTATSTLSLGSTSGTSSSAARPKRVFKPNIPPKRDKNKEEGTPQDHVQPQKTKETADKQRGGAGDRGRGRGRGRGKLIQSSSVFEEGVGEPGARASSSRRGGGGGGRGGRGGGGGSSKGSRVQVSTPISSERLASIINKSENYPVHATATSASVSVAENITHHQGAEDVSADVIEQQQFDPGHQSVTLPLSHYLPKWNVRKKSPKFKPIFPFDFGSKTTSFSNVSALSSSTPVLCLFQLPSHLPILMDQEKKQLSNSLETLPEGRIGKMQLLSDGRYRFILENSLDSEKNAFDVEPGKPTGFRQDVVSIDLENEKLIELGPIRQKFVLTPDIQTLLLNNS